ncbi:response regulator transcription factor [Xanthomonas sp. 60]
MSLRVLIADDHDSVLVGVQTIIETSGLGQVVGAAHGTDELMQLLAAVRADVLVTDLSMPGGVQTDGYVLIELIRRRYPDLPIVVLSMTSNLAIIRMVRKTGVLGLIDKTSSLKELPAAIKAVVGGRSYVSSRLEQRLADAEVDDGGLAGKPVTERENEVLRLMATGMTVSQIAEQLKRSNTTISKQKNSAMRRLGLSNDQELYEYLNRSGFR